MSVWWRHNLSLERKSQTCAFVFEHRSKLTRCYKQLDLLWLPGSLFLEYPFPGKVGSDIGDENPITSIRWTTQFVRVKRISDYIIRLSRTFFMGNASQINRSRNSVRVEGRSDLNDSDLGEVYCIYNFTLNSPSVKMYLK